jgi:ATP-dependent helicase/nuclease subunit B
MGSKFEAEIDAWLRGGGLVITASERAARAVSSTYHRVRRGEGLKAWAAPKVQDWNSFVRSAWMDLSLNGRLILNRTQEQSLWADLARADGHDATLLEGPRYRLADLAQQAHQLLCSYAPRLLATAARSGWQNDAAAFSRWLTHFEQTCGRADLLSVARLPIELLGLLKNSPTDANHLPRKPLLVIGFDRLLPIQREVFDAWGPWRLAPLAPPGASPHSYVVDNEQDELAACALWCSRQLAATAGTRILVVAQNVTAMRGQIERALLDHATIAEQFEFSLGIPLDQIAFSRAALLVLRWLSSSLREHELDWLFSTGLLAASPNETTCLQAQMRALRRRGREQPDWTLEAFLQSFPARSDKFGAFEAGLLQSWINRMTAARSRLGELGRQPQSPLGWAEFIPELLESASFAAAVRPASAEFQAAERWQQALEITASLGFDGRRMDWTDFLSALDRTLAKTLFAPESSDAPIQICGPAESAGLTADAIWFLGATEQAWPASGNTHPLLPPEVQRDWHMPHATPQLDWNLAEAMTARLLASAPEVHFSYARQIEGVEARPSRLVTEVAGAAELLPADLVSPVPARPATVSVEDFSRIPLPPGQIAGGAALLTAQSQCPFKAFATARLGARRWDAAEAGLTAKQRGQLLHAVLESVWAGPPEGIRTHAELVDRADSERWVWWVTAHVRRVFQNEIRDRLSDRMPARYLELEQERLIALVTRWLEYESSRIAFEVLETEAECVKDIAGLQLNLRLDRLDRLIDGSVLVIDYKTGDVKTKSWQLPRPDDIQLPLYARFALKEDHQLGGLAFARVRPGDLSFAGHIGAPVATLFADLKSTSTLAKNPLSVQQLEDWDRYIEQLAKDFLAGRAEVDPSDYPKTCERCGLQTLCRVDQNRIALEGDEDQVGGYDE